MVMKRTVGDWILDSLIYLFLAMAAFLCIAPLINTIAISFSDTAAVNAGLVNFWPVEFTMASYEKLILEGAFSRAFMISVVRVLLGVPINMVLTILMAYPLSKEQNIFKLRNIYVWLIVVTMLFSGGLIPYYITVKTVGLIDTIWALVLPGAVPVFNVILLLNFFRGIPKELDEAATIDGANPWYIAFRIYAPISMPAIATLILFSAVGHWNDFFSGLIFLNDPKNYPLQTYIQQLTLSIDYQNLSDPSELIERLKVSSRTYNAAKILVALIPILCLYPFLQKHFVQGIVLGSVKG